MRLGVYWERAGDLGRARVELQRALALEPSLTAAALALDDLAGRGPWERARALWRKLTHGP
jgi:Tfp pilus assembly protein PilF